MACAKPLNCTESRHRDALNNNPQRTPIDTKQKRRFAELVGLGCERHEAARA